MTTLLGTFPDPDVLIEGSHGLHFLGFECTRIFRKAWGSEQNHILPDYTPFL